MEAFASGNKKFQLTYTQVALLDLLPALRQLDPRQAEEVVRRDHALRDAAANFPEGRHADDGNEEYDGETSRSLPIGLPDLDEDGPPPLQALEQWSTSAGRAMEVLEQAEKDPAATLDQVPSILLDSHRIEVLYAIAKLAKREARSGLLDRCVMYLKEVKRAAERVRALVAMAGIAHESRMPEETRLYLGRAFSELTAVLKMDKGNSELLEFRPSTASARHIAWHAADILGLAAEPLLTNIGDPELALLARVEMTRALLKLPATSLQTSSVREN